MKKIYIGIDFGTTNTFVIGQGKKTDAKCDTTCNCPKCIIPWKTLAESKLYIEGNDFESPGIPSIIGINEKNQWCIGVEAEGLNPDRKFTLLKDCLRCASLNPRTAKLGAKNGQISDKKICNYLSSFKSSILLNIGLELLKPYEIKSGLTIFELTVAFFKCLLESIFRSSYDGDVVSIRDIEKIVIGCPGNEDLYYRDTICDALRQALVRILEKGSKIKGKGGVRSFLRNSLEIIPEPVLAGYAFLNENSDNSAKTYLVVDVGGGTTDFVIIKKTEGGVIDIECKDGHLPCVHGGFSLAGNEFTDCLHRLIVSKKGWDASKAREIKEELSLLPEGGRIYIYKKEKHKKEENKEEDKKVFYSKQDRDAYINKLGKKILSGENYLIFNKREFEEEHDIERDDEDCDDEPCVRSIERQQKLNVIDELFTKITEVLENFLKNETDNTIIPQKILFVGGSVQIPGLKQHISDFICKKYSINESVEVDLTHDMTASNVIALGACYAARKNWKGKRKVPKFFAVAVNKNEIAKKKPTLIEITSGLELYDEEGYAGGITKVPLVKEREGEDFYFRLVQSYVDGKENKYRLYPPRGVGLRTQRENIYIALDIGINTEIIMDLYDRINSDNIAEGAIKSYCKHKNESKFEPFEYENEK